MVKPSSEGSTFGLTIVKQESELEEAINHAVEFGDEILIEDNIVDIGPKTINFYSNSIKISTYILWNGPMGIFENPNSNKGTSAIAKAIARNNKAYSVAGGGSTVQAINQFITPKNLSHVSTGGGAFMEYIENGTLPGINAIIQNKNLYE